jgi:hypothetical protein
MLSRKAIWFQRPNGRCYCLDKEDVVREVHVELTEGGQKMNNLKLVGAVKVLT